MINLLEDILVQNPVFVPIAGGRFAMGDKDFLDNKPHSVLVYDFEIAETLTTQEQYHFISGNNPSYFKNGDTRFHPVEQVSWFDAVEYCKKLSLLASDVSNEVKNQIKDMSSEEYQLLAFNNRTFKLYRLPSEAEWELAAKGGTNYKYGTIDGEISDDSVVWKRSEAEGTAAVKSKKPNAFGLYDMAGNVWQWCMDWHGEGLEDGATNHRGSDTGSLRVLRGGSWYSDNPEILRSAYRLSNDPGDRDYFIGFRPLRTIN